MHVLFGSFGRRFSAVLVLVLLAGAGIGPAFLEAAEDDEAAICQQALSNCLGTAGGAALALDWRSVVKALLICIAGYEFCRKFVEPYIRDEAVS
jgi:hypothetical protein